MSSWWQRNASKFKEPIQDDLEGSTTLPGVDLVLPNDSFTGEVKTLTPKSFNKPLHGWRACKPPVPF